MFQKWQCDSSHEGTWLLLTSLVYGVPLNIRRRRTVRSVIGRLLQYRPRQVDRLLLTRYGISAATEYVKLGMVLWSSYDPMVLSRRWRVTRSDCRAFQL